MNFRSTPFWLLYIACLVVGLTSGAFIASITLGDPVGLLFRSILTGPLILGIVAWSSLAWTIRWLMIGSLSRRSLTTRLGFFWGGFRVAQVGAILSLVVAGVIALASGSAIEALIREALVVVGVTISVAGLLRSAVGNSRLIAKLIVPRRDGLPDPVSYCRALPEADVWAYRDRFGAESREWIIARRELARRKYPTWKRYLFDLFNCGYWMSGPIPDPGSPPESISREQ